MLDNILNKYLTKRFLILFLIFLGVVLYLNTFFNEFLWDDEDILRNVYTKDWHNFSKFFTQNLLNGAGEMSNYWRPLYLLSFALDWHIAKAQPLLYHLHNIFLHIISAILLFLILDNLFKKRYFSFLTSLIFLIHPLQTEVAAYVSGRADPLSALFIFFSLYLFIKTFDNHQRLLIKRWYFLSLICFIFSLLSKETAIVPPFLIMLLMLSFQEKFFPENIINLSPKNRFKEIIFLSIKRMIPFLVILTIFVSLRLTILNFQNILNFWPVKNIYTENIEVRIFTFFRVLLTYLGLIFLPLGLHMEREVLIYTSLFSPQVFLGLLIFLAMVGLAIFDFLKSPSRVPYFFLGIGWFFITLAPYSNIFIPINAIIYEHWMYLPLIGIFICVIHFFENILKKKESYFKKLLILFLIFYLAFLSIKTILRNREWRDAIIFYNQILKYNPTYRVYNNLGNAYSDVGEYEKAKEMYLKAINFDPSFPQPEAYNNLGLVFFRQEQYEETIFYYKEALRARKNYLPALINLGDVYFVKKDWEESKKYYIQYINLYPQNFYPLFKLGEISFYEENCAEAVQYLEKAKEIAPSGAQEIQRGLSELMEEATKCPVEQL